MLLLLFVLFPAFLMSLTLHQAICNADLVSYDLRIKEQEIKIKEGEVWQASLLPNPALDVAVDSFGGNGPYKGVRGGVASYEIQTLWELGGKRSERTQAASMDKLLAEWDFEEARADLLKQLKVSFIDAYVAQEKLKIDRRYYENARRVLAAAMEQMRQGKECKANYSRLKVACLQASIDLEKQEQELFLKMNKLSNFWNESCPSFLDLEFCICDVPYVANLCTYEQQLTNYPGLIRKQLRVARAEREVDVQKSYAWPDVLLSLGVDQEFCRGNTGMRVEVNFPLPFFNVNQGKIFSARQQVVQADLEYKHYYLDLVLELRRIYKYLEISIAQVRLYQQEILPDLEETHNAALDAYEEGKMDLIHYLENERFFLDTKNAFLETLAAFHKYYAELCQYIRGIP